MTLIIDLSFGREEEADGFFIRMEEYTKSFRTIDVDGVDTIGAVDTFLGSFLYELILKTK